MTLLGLDTSTLSASVAIWRELPSRGAGPATGEVLAARQSRVTTHSDALIPMLESALAEAGVALRDLDAVACGAGPGSFTGLRIGLATAKGLCFAIGRPLVLVSSLEAMAARADGEVRVCATLDAHQGEVYAGLFAVSAGTPRRCGEERALAPDALAADLAALAREAPLIIVGEGARRYPELLVQGSRLLDAEPGPHAAEVCRLAAVRLRAGLTEPLASATPRYLRPSEAERKLRKQQ